MDASHTESGGIRAIPGQVDRWLGEHDQAITTLGRRFLDVFAPASTALLEWQRAHHDSVSRNIPAEAALQVGSTIADSLTTAAAILAPSPLTVGLKLFYNAFAPTAVGAVESRLVR